MKFYFFVLAATGSLLACTSSSEKNLSLPESSSVIMPAQDEEARVKVQHLLISFEGRLAGKVVDRSEAEAIKLAASLEKELQADISIFDERVRSLSDDQYPGIYGIANFGHPASGKDIPRSQFAKAFGEAAFSLKVGEWTRVDFHPEHSPYGIHFIKRLD